MTKIELAVQILSGILAKEGAADPMADYTKNGTDCDTYEKVIATDVKRAIDYANELTRQVLK